MFLVFLITVIVIVYYTPKPILMIKAPTLGTNPRTTNRLIPEPYPLMLKF